MRILVILNSPSHKFIPESTYIESASLINTPLRTLYKIVKHFDMIVISGGPQHLYMNLERFPEIKPLLVIVRLCSYLNKILIGICLGCQIIGMAYKMPIIKLPQFVIGHNYMDNINRYMIEKDKYLSKMDFSLIKQSFSFHNDGIENVCGRAELLPPKLETLCVSNVPKKKIIIVASYGDIPYIIKHKKKPIYGFQFHPEANIESIINTIKKNNVNFNIDIMIPYEEITTNFFSAFM
jgi:anthranilate/para-aminobenzoate synthase component II